MDSPAHDLPAAARGSRSAAHPVSSSKLVSTAALLACAAQHACNEGGGGEGSSRGKGSGALLVRCLAPCSHVLHVLCKVTCVFAMHPLSFMHNTALFPWRLQANARSSAAVSGPSAQQEGGDGSASAAPDSSTPVAGPPDKQAPLGNERQEQVRPPSPQIEKPIEVCILQGGGLVGEWEEERRLFWHSVLALSLVSWISCNFCWSCFFWVPSRSWLTRLAGTLWRHCGPSIVALCRCVLLYIY